MCTLYNYCRADRVDVVHFLLQFDNCDPNCAAKTNQVPLDLTNNEGIIKELLARGAKPDHLKVKKLKEALATPTTDTHGYGNMVGTSRKILDEALKYGYIISRRRKVIMLGIAGSGKSTLLQLILGEEPPPIRQSTPCAVRPVRVVRLNNTATQLVRMCPRKLLESLAQAMMAFSELKSKNKDTIVTAIKPYSQKHEESLSKINVKNLLCSSKVAPSLGQALRSEASHTGKLLHSSLLEEQLLALLEKSCHDKPMLKVDWTYLIDSGGQPQFAEVLSALLQGVCLAICLFKLSEELDIHTKIEYHSNGKLIGQPILSTLTNSQLLQRFMCTALSLNAKEQCSSFMLIGSHRDLEHTCSETRDKKEAKLSDLLLPKFARTVVYPDEELKSMIFPINAKEPDSADLEVVNQIRRVILDVCTPQENKIPLQWYCLELKLAEIAQVLGRQVLTKVECWVVAQRLHFNEDSFEAALEYLSYLNIIFYFPAFLPNVVFCDPQLLLDKVTELVEFSYHLRDVQNDTIEVSSEPLMKPNAGSILNDLEMPKAKKPKLEAMKGGFREFRDFGVITLDLLKSERFSKHYYNDVFSPLKLVALFKALLIFSDFRDGSFFMPCLLPCLNDRELRMFRPTTTLPFIIYFPDGPRNGIFCSLMSTLFSCSKSLFLAQLVCHPHSQTPACLYRNCVQFYVYKHPGRITLIDSYKYLEVYVECDKCFRSNLCKVVSRMLLSGLKQAADILHYKHWSIEKTFFCPCSAKRTHLTSVCEGKHCWMCPNDPQTWGELKESQLEWLDTSFDGEYTCVVCRVKSLIELLH